MGRLGVRSGVSHNVSSNAVAVEQDTPSMSRVTREQQHYDSTIEEYYDTLTDFSTVLSEGAGYGRSRERDDSNVVEEILDPKTAAMRRYGRSYITAFCPSLSP